MSLWVKASNVAGISSAAAAVFFAAQVMTSHSELHRWLTVSALGLTSLFFIPGFIAVCRSGQ